MVVNPNKCQAISLNQRKIKCAKETMSTRNEKIKSLFLVNPLSASVNLI